MSALLIWILPSSLYSRSFFETSHGNKNYLPKGCQSCHRGHGAFETPMLPTTKEQFCFLCHGNSVTRDKLRQDGLLSPDVFLHDIQREFSKTYHHPIETTYLHRYGETLPESDPSMPRHVACVDCHHHHYVTEANKHLGLKGTGVDGARLRTIQREYELCFNCHAYSANLPSDQTNKAELLKTDNASYHPVIGPGRNNYVPSLIQPLNVTSTITCTDCHGNDDPFGPKGPHGSTFENILKKRFTASDGSGSEAQYDLCYSCHSSASILGNESFPYHFKHVSELGTSCRTCHNPHGSIQYPHLIDLTSISINPSSSGALSYDDQGDRTGECYLSCHGRDHNPAVYSPAGQPLSTRRLLPRE